ncbi:MAG: prephenate/arogenate dehydrogenase [Cyanobacteriota bacterium]|nr:prephenate/arogenate dehydrogenase [Cyanobacteriota bacterium]
MTPLWRRHPVGIVGLGLIGGSIGLDLRAAGAVVHALVHRPTTAEQARARGLADRISTEPSVLAECALVVLALPLDRLLEPDPALLAALPPGAVVTDVGSVKAPVLKVWRPLMGSRFVASHPMAGTARSGVEAGERGLFHGRPWVATPAVDTDPTALAAVADLAAMLGARWLCCDADAHDRVVALISHLPVLVGAALLQTAASGGDLARALASSGFADTSRVGGGNPELGCLMARTNREALLVALASYRLALDQLEGHLRHHDWPSLRQDLTICQRLRPEFL